MSITLREISDVVIFDIAGEFLRSEMKESPLSGLVKIQLNSGKRKFIINLEKTTSIDSPGVGDILASWVQILNEGGFLKVAINPTNKWFRQGCHPIDLVYASVEAALESLKSPDNS